MTLHCFSSLDSFLHVGCVVQATGQNTLCLAVFSGTQIWSGVFWLGGSESRLSDMGSRKPAFVSCMLRPALLKSQQAILLDSS